MYYAGLLETSTSEMEIYPTQAETWEDAEAEIDALLDDAASGYYYCHWIFDIRDLSNLAQFFGQHKDEFAFELGGEA